ncbi:MAG: chitobiase/beta-hexosaminidase C-terminal domain-containing protein, partial [Bacteroidaceae bacterium]|nr:chitobiase/beta-hexosaminidase C-terminal domain-containing protein [Bacteroidaceae bacterium]
HTSATPGKTKLLTKSTVPLLDLVYKSLASADVDINEDGTIDIERNALDIFGLLSNEKNILTITGESGNWNIQTNDGKVLTSHDNIMLPQAEFVNVTDTTKNTSMSISVDADGQATIKSNDHPGVSGVYCNNTLQPVEVDTLGIKVITFRFDNKVILTQVPLVYIFREVEVPTTYELVTDLAQLKAGDEYLFVEGNATENGKTVETNTVSRQSDKSLIGGNTYLKNYPITAYNYDGFSFCDVTSDALILRLEGEQDNWYFQDANLFLSSLNEKSYNVSLTEDNAYAKLSIGMNDNGTVRVTSVNKTAKSLLSSLYNQFVVEKSSHKFTFAANGLLFSDVYIYRKATLDTIPTPVIQHPGGSLLQPTQVTITCDHDKASIHYTTDGSKPTRQSPRYESPITIDSACTLRAAAFYRISKSETSEAVSFQFQCEKPNLNLVQEDELLTLQATAIKDKDRVGCIIQRSGAETTYDTLTVARPTTIIETLYAGQEFFIQGKTMREKWTDSADSTLTYTHTDADHVTGTIVIDSCQLAEQAYNGGGNVTLTDDKGQTFTTSASPAGLIIKTYPTVKDGKINLNLGQKLLFTAEGNIFNTVTVAATGIASIKINGEAVSAINGLATWHSDEAVSTVTIEAQLTSSISMIRLTTDPNATAVTSVKATAGDAPTYDLTGRMTQARKGILITKGKKVLNVKNAANTR